MMGDGDAGKSELLLKYTDDTFSLDLAKRIGVDLKIKKLQIEG